METKIIPLGTASAVPAGGRHLPAVALRRAGRLLLFDCGEGTQFRLMAAGLNRARIDAIFLTHFHGDHFYGLMGLVATLGILERTDPLTVVGPAGLERMWHALPVPASRGQGLPFPITFVELEQGFGHEVVYQTEELTVEACPVEHRIFCAGYRFEEKPRTGHLHPEKAEALGVTAYAHFRALKRGEAVTTEGGRRVEPEEVIGPERPGASFAYVTDTRPCAAGRTLAEEVDLLYHEATFRRDLQERAEETGHATAREAAEVAREAGAERLLLGHFSARYQEPAPLVREAQAAFPNTEAAEELKRYVLGKGERGKG